MVKISIVASLAFAALVSRVSAYQRRNFTDFPTDIRVGQLYTLHWDLNPGESVGRLTLQHEDAGGAVVQYETLVQWTDASGENSKGLGVTSVDWVPNVAGPSFHLYLNDNAIYSPRFSILAADGTPVTTVDPNIQGFSNIMPQTATPIWYPNDPHKTAPAASSTTTPPSTSSTLVVPVASVSAPAAVATSTPPTAVTTYVKPSSIITVTASTPAAASTTLATASFLPLPFTNTTLPASGSGTVGSSTQSPTSVYTGAAAALLGGSSSAVAAAAGCAVLALAML